MRLGLSVVEAYSSEVRGEPCAAAQDRAGGVLAGRICAGRGVGGPRAQGADASGSQTALERRVQAGQLEVMRRDGRMTRAAKQSSS